MATGKDTRGSPSKGGMDWSSGVRPGVVQRPPDPAPNEQHIPWTLLVTVVVMCLVLVIALPVMGIMYMDMNNATNAALNEIRKMKELRLKILKERLDADRTTTQGDDPAQ
jgi:cytochrome b561